MRHLLRQENGVEIAGVMHHAGHRRALRNVPKRQAISESLAQVADEPIAPPSRQSSWSVTDCEAISDLLYGNPWGEL
jgi:hypothetical protein